MKGGRNIFMTNIIIGVKRTDVIKSLEYTLQDYLYIGTNDELYTSMDYDAMRQDIEEVRHINANIDKSLVEMIDEWAIWNLDFSEAWEVNYEIDKLNLNTFLSELDYDPKVINYDR
tara:strand:+ start:2722 stop:3069 length:348 start_codon:yes stop_codon:yes gene_type:complete